MKTCRPPQRATRPLRSLAFPFALVAALALALAPRLSAQDAASVEGQVRQLFTQRCSECHGRDLPPAKRKGNKQMFLDAQTTRAELELL